MQMKFARDTVLREFRASIKNHIKQAQRMGMSPPELVVQLAGHEADLDFINNWEDAEREVACSWLRTMEKGIYQ